MAVISDISIVPFGSRPAQAAAYGTARTICDADSCRAINLAVYTRAVEQGRRFELSATNDYHLVYVMHSRRNNFLHFVGETHDAEQGAGVLLAPGEAASFEASAGGLELLHIAVPKPPAEIENGLPGGPGYFFNRKTLRALTDASGGRIRRFCAESSVKLRDGQRLTCTNAIQAGEMHYKEGGSSPYHMHLGTNANPKGAGHCYITFQGRGLVEVENESRELSPDTLVYFPPGVPHRLRAYGGTLDYFEIQAWRSFKTKILSEEPEGLKWFYEPESPGGALIDWNQS